MPVWKCKYALLEIVSGNLFLLAHLFVSTTSIEVGDRHSKSSSLRTDIRHHDLEFSENGWGLADEQNHETLWENDFEEAIL